MKKTKTIKVKGRKVIVDVEGAIHEIAHAIAHMKDDQCGNAGYNWLQRFYDSYSLNK